MRSENNEKEIDKELMKFERKLTESQQPLDPEFEKIFRDNFWELLA